MIPAKIFNVDTLSAYIYPSEAELAEGAAIMGRDYLQEVLNQQQTATVLLATGNSQIQFLAALTAVGGVDWSHVTLFHLDEYLGIEADSPASFRYYLRERVEKQVNPAQFHYIQGDAVEPLAECDRYTKLLMAQSIDLCLLGIGQNGHLAFNEPEVANFKDPYRIKLVKLADQTRQAQLNQGYFPHLAAVPQYAFTVTIPMLTSAQKIFCLAPGASKAPIIKTIIKEGIAPTCPASILRQHKNATLFLDKDSASLIES